MKKNNNEDEIWISVENYENYEINQYGIVRNKLTGRLNKGTLNVSGYTHHRFYKKDNGKKIKKDIATHTIVAKYFVPNPENKKYVNHIDEDRANPVASNLEWVTAKENANHGSRNYKISKGGYPVCEYDLEGKFIRTWLSSGMVAKVYPISARTIQDAMTKKLSTAYGRQWRKLEETQEMPIAKLDLKGWHRHNMEKKIKSGIYNHEIEVPLEYLYLDIEVDIFNSITAIEILDGVIKASSLNVGDKRKLKIVKEYMERTLI